MSKLISNKMKLGSEVVFTHSPEPAYLALVDADSYQFFASSKLDYHGMLSHLGKQMAKHACVAWGCPETTLTIRLVLSRDHTAFESVTQYATGFQRWIRTSGRLCFSSHEDLYRCATDAKRSLFSFPRTKSPDPFLSRQFVVPPGLYSIIVLRHFGWFEGDQDAPQICNGTHYTVILRLYQDESHVGPLTPPSSIPWA